MLETIFCQCPSSACAPPQSAGGQLWAPLSGSELSGGDTGHGVPSHCLGCSSWPPPQSPRPRPLILQAGPRFDLKLYQIKLGTLDQTEVENEWVLRPYMNTARKRQAL